MTAASPRSLKVNETCPPDREINILLLGQTGIGKSTFINSLANYFINNTLDEAIHDEIKVVIPSSFSFVDSETFEEKTINIGDRNKTGIPIENGQSSTQQCQSFVFPAGGRNLRLIDTPGMGDTRGSEYDNKNLFEILTYISQYEHLNGICIFLKPNEERLTIVFRLCIRQILHYLHPHASENIVFIFTNARSTLFTPGSSKKLLQTLLNEHRDKYGLDIPFSKDNTFLLDNEPFRYLALHRQGIKINKEQVEIYSKSWDCTIKEYERLIIYISQRPLHAVGDSVSLNAAEQHIRKFSRPIAETFRLIAQNIQLAEKYKQKLSQKKANTPHEFYQYTVESLPFPCPRLVCVGKKCLGIIDAGHEKTIEYKCVQNNYLIGVVQEVINDPRIKECEEVDNVTGQCTKCGCIWEKHVHITYEYRTNLTPLDMKCIKNDYQSLLHFADKHIQDLEEERAKIKEVYIKLLKFLHINAVYPFNDDIVYYLRVLIAEETMKQKEGDRDEYVFMNLSEIMTEYENDMNILKKSLTDENRFINTNDMSAVRDMFELAGDLYHLVINGNTIRSQISLLKTIDKMSVKQKERNVKLPARAASSDIMVRLKDVMSS